MTSPIVLPFWSFPTTRTVTSLFWTMNDVKRFACPPYGWVLSGQTTPFSRIFSVRLLCHRMIVSPPTISITLAEKSAKAG